MFYAKRILICFNFAEYGVKMWAVTGIRAARMKLGQLNVVIKNSVTKNITWTVNMHARCIILVLNLNNLWITAWNVKELRSTSTLDSR